MNARIKFGWSGAAALIVLCVIALGLNLEGIANYLTSYPLERSSQALSGLAFTAPLIAGFCAFTAGRLKKVISRPIVRRPEQVLRSVMFPTVGIVLVVTLTLSVLVAGFPTGLEGISIFALVTITYAGSMAFGTLFGLIFHRAIGAPLVIVITFAWYAMPISTAINWLRTANTASLLGSCCTPDQRFEPQALVTSAIAAAIILFGSVVSISFRRTAAQIVGLALTVVLTLGASYGLGRFNSFDGLTVRTQSPICSLQGNLTVCVWPENRSVAKVQAQNISFVLNKLDGLDLHLPTLWSESPIIPEDAASTTAGVQYDTDTRRASVLFSLTEWWGCEGESAEKIFVISASLTGVDPSPFLGGEGLESVVERAATESSGGLRQWLGDELNSDCPNA